MNPFLPSKPAGNALAAAALPEYIRRSGDLVARQPFLHQGTFLRTFVLEADLEKLQALCDRVFNRPSGGTLNYRPLTNSILLTFAEIRDISSTYEEDGNFGSMSEIDVAFWIPLLSERGGRPHVSWYIPYIFVDNPYAMATGRELYGFPKTIGRFQIPQEIDGPDSYWVETMSMERFAAGSRVHPMRIFEVRRTADKRGAPGRLARAASLLPILLGDDPAPGARLALSWNTLRNALRDRSVQMLFLRQLRDVRDPARAAYQEVIEAPAQVTRARRGGLIPGQFELHLAPNAAFPIAEELGLCADGHPVRAAVWVDFDFLVGFGVPLWNAAQTAG